MRVRLRKSPRFDKKFRVTFDDGKVVDFGAEEECSYQIEFEIVDPTKVSSRDEFFNIVHSKVKTPKHLSKSTNLNPSR